MAMIATQHCWPIGVSPVRPRIITVPMARNRADTSISPMEAGDSSTTGSKPSTSTPAKLAAMPATVFQPIRSPRNSTASSVAIGT